MKKHRRIFTRTNFFIILDKMAGFTFTTELEPLVYSAVLVHIINLSQNEET